MIDRKFLDSSPVFHVFHFQLKFRMHGFYKSWGLIEYCLQLRAFSLEYYLIPFSLLNFTWVEFQMWDWAIYMYLFYLIQKVMLIRLLF